MLSIEKNYQVYFRFVNLLQQLLFATTTADAADVLAQLNASPAFNMIRFFV